METLGMLCSIKLNDILIDTNDFAWFTLLLVLCNPVELALDSALGGKELKIENNSKTYLIFQILFISKERTDRTMEHGITSIGNRFP